jgi:hypothetical protein
MAVPTRQSNTSLVSQQVFSVALLIVIGRHWLNSKYVLVCLFAICLKWEKENVRLWSAGEKMKVGPRLQDWLKSLQTEQFHLLCG